MVVTNRNVQEPWNFTLVLGPVFFEIFHEPVGTGNVGDIRVIGRKVEASIVVQDLWHRIVDARETAGPCLGFAFVVVGQLIAFTIVTERETAA